MVSAKRMLIAFLLLLLGFSTIYKNLVDIIFTPQYTATAQEQSKYRLELGNVRGTIYDRYFMPLVNEKYQYSAGVLPLPSAVTALRSSLSEEKILAALAELENGRPAKVVSEDKIPEAQGISVYKLPVRYNDSNLAEHLVGYMSNGVGVSGIEKAYEDILSKNGGSVELVYSVDALGTGLGNGAAEVIDSLDYTHNVGGVVLTLDKRFQKICEDAMDKVEKGALVLLNVKTGEILAGVSKPSFSRLNIEEALSGESGEIFNRILAETNVGSVFKPLIAAIAIENGISVDTVYKCEGHYTYADTTYYCHNKSGHSEIDMLEAMKTSCNVYFMKLGESLGKSKILEFIQNLSFGENITIANGIEATSSVPSLEEMTTGELLNFSFGQGKLMASPVHIAALMAAIANGGVYNEPYLYLGETKDAYKFSKSVEKTEGERVMNEETAEKIKKLLKEVVISGSGKRAAGVYSENAGKTGSAQTGQWQNGSEIINGWFAGYFPAESPRYALAVLEVGGEGQKLPAEIFSEISSKIILLENPNIAVIR